MRSLRQIRIESGQRQVDLIEATGLEKTTVWRYEQGRTSIFNDGARAIFGALGLKTDEAIVAAVAGAPRARLLGDVGAGAEVFPLDEDGDRLVAPPGMAAPVAVRVTGSSMTPAYQPGDILFAEEAAQVAHDVVNRDCILQTADGKRLVKRVHRGSAPGLFRLFSYETQDLTDDVELLWAAPVRWVQRG